MVVELHKQGADINAEEEMSAADRKRADADELARGRSDYDPTLTVAPTLTGDRPVHVAAAKGHTAVLSKLFFLRAKMEEKNRVGSTALHRAVAANQVATAAELIKLGANVHAKNNMKMTPMHIAVAGGYLEMIKMLLKTSAVEDLREPNLVKMTPIEYTLEGSVERNLLLSHDPSLADLLDDEEPDVLDQTPVTGTPAADEDEDEAKAEDEE